MFVCVCVHVCVRTCTQHTSMCMSLWVSFGFGQKTMKNEALLKLAHGKISFSEYENTLSLSLDNIILKLCVYYIYIFLTYSFIPFMWWFSDTFCFLTVENLRNVAYPTWLHSLFLIRTWEEAPHKPHWIPFHLTAWYWKNSY